MKGEHLCILSALNPRNARFKDFVQTVPYYEDDDDDDKDSENLEATVRVMAPEILEFLGQEYDLDATQDILTEALTLPSLDEYDFACWLEDYLGRRHHWNSALSDLENEYFRTAVVIGTPTQDRMIRRNSFALEVVEEYNDDWKHWSTVVIRDAKGVESRVQPNDRPEYGAERGNPFFCWERPYRYFQDWMRRSCPLASADDNIFARQFYRVVDSNRCDPRTDVRFLLQ